MQEVVLVTGISSGFGKQTAELLSQNGYKVYGISRKETAGNPKIHQLIADVTAPASVKQAVETLLKAEGRIDVLVNNAGMGISGSIEESSTEEIRLQMDTNFMGFVHTIQAVLPAMRKQGEGKIINISSIGGLMGLPFQGFYSASKFAVEGLSEGLRMELKQFNIKVVLVEPGDFHTNFTANRKLIAARGKASPYESQFSKTISVIEKDENGGLPPSVLAKKLLKIIEKKNPCQNYVVATFEQKLAVFLKKILLGSWFTAILSPHYGIK